MLVALCLDNNNGLLFNDRRQSRDIKVCEDFISSSQGKIYLEEYSRTIFESFDGVSYCDNPIELATKDDSCFVEKTDVTSYLDRIDTIVIYNWNRDYPFDISFDIDLESEGFRLESVIDFIGNSHEKITKEVYKK